MPFFSNLLKHTDKIITDLTWTLFQLYIWYLNHQFTLIADLDRPSQCLVYLQDWGKVGLRSFRPCFLRKKEGEKAAGRD